MIIDIQAWASNQRILVKAPQANLHVDLPNIVALNKLNRKIAALGKTEEEMQEQSALGWRLHKDKIEFTTPFSANSFDAKTAHAVLMYYADYAARLLRPGTFGQMLSVLTDRFNVDVRIANYENIPIGLQEDFTRLMRHDRMVNVFILNGLRLKG
jgi:hypothetical protein